MSTTVAAVLQFRRIVVPLHTDCADDRKLCWPKRTVHERGMIVFVVKDQDTLMTSLYQFTLLELVLDYDLQITVT